MGFILFINFILGTFIAFKFSLLSQSIMISLFLMFLYFMFIQKMEKDDKKFEEIRQKMLIMYLLGKSTFLGMLIGNLNFYFVNLTH